MFTSFSPAAKHVLRLAEQECRNFNHFYLGADHLLLALCEERDAAVMDYFVERRIALEPTIAALRQALGTGEDRAWDGILGTPRVRTIVGLAEAFAGPGALVEPVHLLDALVREASSTAAEILRVAASQLAADPPRQAAG
ncbi:MAG: hypothetical protein GIW95_03925 [Candidatus Eremiobacteraeota bacterium]|nr:hypothetical protein [Candidatus Eremiobacteraeota bacterium]